MTGTPRAPRPGRLVACALLLAAQGACFGEGAPEISSPPPSTGPATPPTWSPHAPARDALPDDPLQALDALGATVRPAMDQRDFPMVHSATHDQRIATPRSESQVARLVALAAEADLSVRVRGRGHSMSGRVIAGTDELLLSTSGLRRLCRVGDDVVEAGTGPSVTTLDAVLREHGLQLRVVNDGGHGPSLGGYIATGGFAGTSDVHGGLWQVTPSITLVDGRGAVHTLTRDDPDFGWLFGSSGQLGVMTRATLEVDVVDPALAADRLPVGTCTEVPDRGDVQPPSDPWGDGPRLYWWSVFVPEDQAQLAAAALADIRRMHEGPSVRFLADYRYRLAPGPVRAPLVHDIDGPAQVRGIWASPIDPEGTAHLDTVRAIEKAVDAWATAQGHRRYLGAELQDGPAFYRRQLGEDLYARFSTLKDRFDPDHRIGRGVVFDAPASDAP